MILKSSRGNSLKQISLISFGCWILAILLWGLRAGFTVTVLIYATFSALLVFGLLGAFILPNDIFADDKYIYIIKYFKRYRITLNEVKMVEMYMVNNGRMPVPTITITKNNGESVTQHIAIMDDKGTDLLIQILKFHNIQVYKHKLKKSYNDLDK